MIAAIAMLGAMSIAAPTVNDLAPLAREAGLAGEIYVADKDRVLAHHVASRPDRPHHAGELWRWASVSKQLTATLIMQAVDEGRLATSDTLDKALPAFKGQTAARITIAALLTHTSGLPNPDDSQVRQAGDFPDFYRRTKGAGSDALGYCAGAPKAEPGQGFAYNNCDYIVLGAVLERIYGQPYRTLVRQRLGRAAGLKSIDVAEAGRARPRLAPGYLENGVREPDFELSTFGAAGAVYGKAIDLVRFDQALLRGQLLSPAARAQAWAGDPKLGYVAFGVWSYPASLRGCDKPVKLVERRGEIGGVEVRNLLAPERGRALVVFADSAGIDFGEIWQGSGLSYRLASAAFCGT
ncbi:serine hydrolase [Caulobacter sp. FWC2]|uniref:serine hydrolase domain-containing protein n=1 Tax=Caulobacter sp. FWC2 TaxID=69664 RepID=UPI000C15E8D6|nr:serine hydrolase domain-containing protein [Caulobacter sp. FWC2]PIB90822.1 serine hydrolase [Caulobacter sp. FWC2]